MGGLCKHLQIETLRQQLAQGEQSGAWRNALATHSAQEEMTVVSSGCPELDRILPQNGFRPGTLVEWLGHGAGDGTATLAFRAAACALRAAAGASSDGRAVVVLDPSGEFYPPAAIAQGIEPARLIVIHPGNQADHTWALDQVLRCPAVAAAVAWPERIHHAETKSVGCGFSPPSSAGGLKPTLQLSSKLDGRTFRRLQLAVEQGGGLGLLIRPATVRGEPSWADVRLFVEPLEAIKGTVPTTMDTWCPRNGPEGAAHKWGLSPLLRRRLRMVLLRCRGGRGEQTVEVEIDDEPHSLHQS
jgi:protein ImuA